MNNTNKINNIGNVGNVGNTGKSSNNNSLNNSLTNSLNNNKNSYTSNNTSKNNSSRNTSSNNSSKNSTGYSGTSVIGIILAVIVLIAVAGSSYWLYNYYSSITFSNPLEVEVMPNVIDGSISSTISSSAIPTSTYSNEYSISFWINVQDYNYKYGEEKVIISRGAAGSGNPEIVLDTKTNDLIVRVQLQGNISNSTATTVPAPSQTIVIPVSTSSTSSTVPVTTRSSSSFTDIDITNSESFNDNNVFANLGNNAIDYPTLQYVSEKNSFSDITNEESDIGYFDLISGNNVQTDNKKNNTTNTTTTNNTNNTNNTTTEDFDNTYSPSLSTSIASQSASAYFDSNRSANSLVGSCVAKMIPLQKWVNVIVSVYNQIIDIYFDGQLVSSCVLKGFPAVSTSDVNVTPNGGFSGKLSRIVFMNTAMTVSSAKRIYYSGPIVTSSLFSLIPNWVYWGIVILIIIAIAYSMFV